VPDVLSWDYETRSPINLITHGAYVYATDPGTGIYNLGWAFNDEPPQVWHPGEPFPQRMVDHINNGGIIQAWNAAFERLITWYVLCPDYGVPEPAMEQFRCTAARARAHGLPSSLENCTRALGTGIYKNPEGTRLIKEYCAQNVPWEGIPPADQALMDLYAAGDVDAERSVTQFLRELTDDEWYEYHLNEHLNDFGIPIDTAMAAAALEYAEDVRVDVDAKVLTLTDGKVASTRKRNERDAWVLPQLTENQIKLITNKAKGKISFDEAHRTALLVHPELPPKIAAYLDLVAEAGGATIGKYKAMALRQIEGRVNGILQWNGAGQTGRFSSLGLQFHNLRRDSFDYPEPIIDDLMSGYELDDVTTTLARLVRSTVYRPDGLTWFDWSSIEGRVAPWLSDSPAGEAKLQLYIDGVDPYKVNAASYFDVHYDDVTKDQRQAGKLQELALQFLGGVGALHVMGQASGVHLEDAEAELLRDAWRKLNPWAKSFGAQLDNAAIKAIGTPGEWFHAGRVAYAFDGGDWLWCRLPSGRLLAYFQPRREFVETPWGDEHLAVTVLWGSGKPKVGEDWPRRGMHAGLWLENVTQAAAADILREAVIRIDDAGLDIVLTVHDEVVVEGHCVEQLGAIMLQMPAWAVGLPLDGEGDSGTRYGK